MMAMTIGRVVNWVGVVVGLAFLTQPLVNHCPQGLNSKGLCHKDKAFNASTSHILGTFPCPCMLSESSIPHSSMSETLKMYKPTLKAITNNYEIDYPYPQKSLTSI